MYIYINIYTTSLFVKRYTSCEHPVDDKIAQLSVTRVIMLHKRRKDAKNLLSQLSGNACELVKIDLLMLDTLRRINKYVGVIKFIYSFIHKAFVYTSATISISGV